MNSPKSKLTIVAAVVLVAAALYYLDLESSKYELASTVAGVDIYSRIPIEQFMEKSAVALENMSGRAETTCNLEIAATSTGERTGYRVHLERKPLGIYLDNRDAYVRGETDGELLQACHAFLCLREGIDCPGDLDQIREVALKNTDLIIVLDNETGHEAGKAYSELLGMLGYLQATLADSDNNGTIEQEEIDANKYIIFPYIMNGNTCTLKALKNALQELRITNDTTDCEFRSGIFLQKSSLNRIYIDGQKIMITGDDDHIRKAAVIVRDIISPDWILAYYRR